MPCFNVVGYVETAISSIRNQTWGKIELIAVDDGSTDGTADLVERIARDWAAPDRRLVLIRQANAGAAAARNTGLDRATGDLLAFLDADDTFDPDCLARLAARLDAAPDIDLTFPEYRYIDARGDLLGMERTGYKRRYEVADLMIRNPIHSATGVMLRRDAAEAAGRFDPQLEACIDLDYWTRIALLAPGNIGGTEGAAVCYRKRGGQITGNWERMRRNWLAVCKKLERAGNGLTERQFAEGRGRNALYWATIAYQSGDYTNTRRLTLDMWRADPRFAVGNQLAWIRTLSAMISVMPATALLAMGTAFNGLRGGKR